MQNRIIASICRIMPSARNIPCQVRNRKSINLICDFIRHRKHSDCVEIRPGNSWKTSANFSEMRSLMNFSLKFPNNYSQSNQKFNQSGEIVCKICTFLALIHLKNSRNWTNFAFLYFCVFPSINIRLWNSFRRAKKLQIQPTTSMPKHITLQHHAETIKCRQNVSINLNLNQLTDLICSIIERCLPGV